MGRGHEGEGRWQETWVEGKAIDAVRVARRNGRGNVVWAWPAGVGGNVIRRD